MKSLFTLFRSIAAATLFLGLAEPSSAQNIPEGIGAAAVTTVDAQGHPWVYIRWTAQNPAVFKNQCWAVYGRPGALDAGGNFTRLGLALSSSDPAVIRVRLGQAAAIGDDLIRLEAVLNDLLAPTRWNGPINGTLEEKISAAMNRAAGENTSAEMLNLMTTGFPSMALMQGQAWAQSLPVAIGQPYTLEVRQADAANPALDGPVLTRVQVTAGQATLLPAPGTPQQVCDVSPRGHLAIKLWWPIPAELRKLSLSAYGYNLYRVPQAQANSLPTAITAEILRAGVNAGTVKKVNTSPILTKEAPASAIPQGPADDATPYYFADDNGVGDKLPGAIPFTEGETFTYFLVARDLLGKEGAVALRGNGTAFSTLPPQAPTDLAVEEITDPIDSTRRLKLTWTQNADNAPIRTDAYRIFHGVINDGGNIVPAPLSIIEQRNENPASMALFETTLVTTLPHEVNRVKKQAFIDTQLPRTVGLMDRTLWFAVQPIHHTPVGCVVPGIMTPPAFGLYRTTQGPVAPEGAASFSCPRIALGNGKDEGAENFVRDAVSNLSDAYSYRAEWDRHRNDIAWVEAYIVKGGPGGEGSQNIEGKEVVTDLGKLHWAPEEDLVMQEFTQTQSEVVEGRYLLSRTGDDLGALSCWHLRAIPPYEDKSLVRRLQFRTRSVTSAMVEKDSWVGQCLLFYTEGGHGPEAGRPLSGGKVSRDTGVDGRVQLPGSLLPPAAQNATSWDGMCYRIEPPAVIGSITLTKLAGSPGAIGFSTWSFSIADPGMTAENINNYCVAIFRDAPNVCGHAPRPSDSADIVPVNIEVKVDAPNVFEYRLFRSFNDDQPSLIKQDAQDFTKNNITSIVATDSAMPKAAGTLRYYAQTADEHGNASPLRLIATVPLLVAPAVPNLDRPVTGLNAAGEAEVKLHWICPPDGVQRFLLHVVPDAPVKSIKKGGPLLQVYDYLPPQGGKLFKNSLKQNAAQIVSTTVGVHALLKLQESFYTPSPGKQGFEPGPEYTTTVRIHASGNYKAWVQAVDQNGTPGPKSAIRSFSWKPAPPPAPTYNIPWPQRPMPVPVDALINANGKTATATVVKVYTPPNHGAVQLQPDPTPKVIWPIDLGGDSCIGVRIGQWQSIDGPIPINDEEFGQAIYLNTTKDANERLMVKIGPGNGGIMLYRQQLPNARFPKVSGATIQCTDRLDRIVQVPGIGGASLVDRRIAVGFDPQNASQHPNDPKSIEFFLLDQQPQVSGATYAYTLVHFRPDGEIGNLHSAGTVTLP